MRTYLAAALATSMALTSSAALAQGCPPGSWFCADAQAGGQAGTQTAPAAAAQGNGQLAPLPPPAQPATTVVVNNAPPAPAPAAPAPAPVRAATVYVPTSQTWPQREWGLNLHMQGAMIAKREDVSSAGMAGIGGALRYRPTRSIALEGSIDLYGGKDYAGQRRSEAAFSVGGYLFMSPQSRTQPYLTGGIGWAAATINGGTRYAGADNGFTMYDGSRNYSYFGAYVGLGVEHRMTRNLAINADLRGFVRGRTDNDGSYEFVASDGRATNTSGGLLLNIGASLYF
jgi:hypothetical protein